MQLGSKMGLFKSIFSSLSSQGRPLLPRRFSLQARYDAAQTSVENRKHWAMADALSADASANSQVRLILRSRSRYEVANNSYARGIILTLANYIVGTGPRLQMQTDSAALNREIETEFSKWMDAVGLAAKLRLMRVSQAESGEVFAILASNPKVDSPVQLDVRVIEADQVTTPLELFSINNQIVDGIVFDSFDNPVLYYVLKFHPGSSLLFRSFSSNDFSVIDASAVLHLFRTDRPGQTRGVPEMTSALPLFALLRRYTLAVLGSAEHAALPSGIIYTDTPGLDPADVDPMDTIEMERGSWLTLPASWKIGQIKAEQPTTVYQEFKHEILNEICRCVNMPFNIAAGNSSDYNYASGRLDHQMFFRSIGVDRHRIQQLVLDPLFKAWLNEAVLVEGFLSQKARTTSFESPHQWIWDGFEHVDPAKEANAQGERLKNSTTTLAAEYAKCGLDWENEIRQRARELDLMRELNIPDPSGAEQVVDPAQRSRDQALDDMMEDADV
jgi:lambda family phage portal protein